MPRREVPYEKVLAATLLAVLVTMPVSLAAQQIAVIPAVSDNTPGVNGSIWATEVQVIKKNPEDALTVRRLWVCVPEGGFLEDPATALTWELPRPRPEDRILTLLGEDLLEGTDSSLGAVALVIEGGEAIVNARVGDVSRGEWVGMTPFGQGQRVPTNLEGLSGPSHIPWVGGCRSAPCNLDPPLNWDYFRNNLGIVNPNSEELTVDGLAIPFGLDTGAVPIELAMADDRVETFSRTVAPYGWSQFQWVAKQHYDFNIWGMPLLPIAGFVITLDPDHSNGYYAYASTVFAPDPDSGVPAFNDPMFISAESGAVAPYRPDP
jgi:hypothetical protein